jgi:hypothetical protein
VENLVFPRIREITDAMGARLRIIVEAHPGGAMITLERPGQHRQDKAMLDLYAAEVLWGYIMSARLALPGDLPDERIESSFQTRLSLRHEPSVGLMITQSCMERPFEIPATFWDRLYAELCVANAHARELGRRAEAEVMSEADA